MTWQKVSDDLWRHPKVALMNTDKLLPCAGLWALSLSWAGANLTDGYVTRRALIQIAGQDVDDLAQELVRVGLWEPFADGYVFHDYLEYNPSQNEVMTLRATREQAARTAGKARAAGANRCRSGQFASVATSVDAGSDAGQTPALPPASRPAPYPVSRLPYSRSPTPNKAAADTAAIDAPHAKEDVA